MDILQSNSWSAQKYNRNCKCHPVSLLDYHPCHFYQFHNLRFSKIVNDTWTSLPNKLTKPYISSFHRKRYSQVELKTLRGRSLRRAASPMPSPMFMARQLRASKRTPRTCTPGVIALCCLSNIQGSQRWKLHENGQKIASFDTSVERVVFSPMHMT